MEKHPPTPRPRSFRSPSDPRALCVFCACCVFVIGYFRLCIRHGGDGESTRISGKIRQSNSKTRARDRARSGRCVISIDSREDDDDEADFGDASSSMSIVGDAAGRRERPRRRLRSRRRVSRARWRFACARGRRSASPSACARREPWCRGRGSSRERRTRTRRASEGRDTGIITTIITTGSVTRTRSTRGEPGEFGSSEAGRRFITRWARRSTGLSLRREMSGNCACVSRIRVGEMRA